MPKSKIDLIQDLNTLLPQHEIYILSPLDNSVSISAGNHSFKSIRYSVNQVYDDEVQKNVAHAGAGGLEAGNCFVTA